MLDPEPPPGGATPFDRLLDKLDLRRCRGLAQLLNLLSLGFQRQLTAYFLGLALLLLIGAIQFAHILLVRPERGPAA